MTDPQMPDGPSALVPARVRLGVLTMTVLLPAAQDEVWRRITDPALLAQWSPMVPDQPLSTPGQNQCRTEPDDEPVDASVTESNAPWFLEHRWGGDQLTWQLAPSGEGTQLNLVHESAGERANAELAALWHVALTVLRDQLEGRPASRRVGGEAVEGWQSLCERYRSLLDGQG